MKQKAPLVTAWVLVGLAVCAHGLTITNSAPTASELVTSIVGSGIAVSGTPTLTCASGSAAVFTSANSALGFDSGIILSSGCAGLATTTNLNDKYKKTDGSTVTLGTGYTSCDKGQSGDTSLNTLVNGTTYDACSLSFTFKTQSNFFTMYFKFSFASEEYGEYVGNAETAQDAVGVFLDGENIGFITGTETSVSINNINNGPWGLGVNATNSAFFKNNAHIWDSGSGSASTPPYNIEYNGYTHPFIGSKVLDTSSHTIKFVVADVVDRLRDSALFISAASFTSTIAPFVSHIEPKVGGTGTRVTIFGAGFLPEYQYTCTFNGQPALRYWRQNDKRLLCEAAHNTLGSAVAVEVKYRDLSEPEDQGIVTDLATSAPQFTYTIEAALGGTIMSAPGNKESAIRAGGSTITLTFTGLTWASGTTFDSARQDIIDGFVSSNNAEAHGWNNAVRPAINVTDVVRTSDTVVTVTLPAVSGFSIASDESVRVAIPYWATAELAVISSGGSIDIYSEAKATVGGTLLDYAHEPDMADTSKTKTVVLTLDGTTWVGGTEVDSYKFTDARQSIIDGIKSEQSEAHGWNVEVKNRLKQADVVRTSDAVVSLTLRDTSQYHIYAGETIRFTVPADAVQQGSAVECEDTVAITNVDTFWELYGVTIIVLSVTGSTLSTCCFAATFVFACCWYRVQKNRKKREVLKTHQVAEDMARQQEKQMEDVDRGLEVVFNSAHGMEGDTHTRDRTISTSSIKARLGHNRVATLEKIEKLGGTKYGVLEAPSTPP